MSRRADYPEWVLKHLSKGVYVNKVGDKYYLYKAHSEKIPGTTKSRRVSDGYLGSITEDKGFIPAKKKNPRITTFDYGLPFVVDSCCQLIHKGLRVTYRKNGTLVYVCSMLSFLYGLFSQELLETSWLSIRYPGITIPEKPSEAAFSAITRGTRMISDTVSRTYGEDWNLLRAHFASYVLVLLDGAYLLPQPSDTCLFLAKKHLLNLLPSVTPWLDNE